MIEIIANTYFFKVFLALFVCHSYSHSSAQEGEKIYNLITLDTFVVLSDNSFDNKAFMKMVMEDTSFHEAFKLLQTQTYLADGDIRVFNKKEKEKAREIVRAEQFRNKDVTWQNHEYEEVIGKLRNKKGQHKYITSELYYDLFFPTDTNSSLFENSEREMDNSKSEKYKEDLKVMMFNPGEDVMDVPIVGKKMSIFDDDMVKYYDYNVSLLSFQGHEAYLFTCTAKPEYKADKTVIKTLSTYFDIETNQVLQRSYILKYNSMLFQFRVYIAVENLLQNGILTPHSIEYNGEWDIPFKTQEAFNFDIYFRDFNLQKDPK